MSRMAAQDHPWTGRSPVNSVVHSRIKEIRLLKGLRVADVARRAGMKPGSYSCLENGHYRYNLDNLFRVLHALQADIREVWPDGAPDSQERAMRPQTGDILEVVCRLFDVRLDELKSRRRYHPLTDARAVAGLLAIQCGRTVSEVADSLGYTVSSLSHAYRRRRNQDTFQCLWRQGQEMLLKEFPKLKMAIKEGKEDA